jgi:excisionase family DNA binding protein
MDQELLTVPEAAARARLAPRSLRRAIARRQLAVVRPGGMRRVLIPVNELMAFVYGGRHGEPLNNVHTHPATQGG